MDAQDKQDKQDFILVILCIHVNWFYLVHKFKGTSINSECKD